MFQLGFDCRWGGQGGWGAAWGRTAGGACWGLESRQHDLTNLKSCWASQEPGRATKAFSPRDAANGPPMRPQWPPFPLPPAASAQWTTQMFPQCSSYTPRGPSMEPCGTPIGHPMEPHWRLNGGPRSPHAWSPHCMIPPTMA